ncbi:MAG TPA: sodium transporter, partial [Flavisolibacter sp.]|nr:sodium transporter [Flavisolibacter sp.]
LFATIGGFALSVFFKFLPMIADLSFLAPLGFSKDNGQGIYEIPFIDRMGFVFIICVAGMYIISTIETRKGVRTNGLIIDRKMFKLSPAFTVGTLIVVGLITALYTVFW